MRFIGAFALLALVVTACGDHSTGSCTEIREPEDPLSVQHVIDPAGVTYLTDPPTSGPHLSGPAPTGLLASPLPPAAQVNVLESGAALVQYAAPVRVDDVRPLLETGDAIVIAPATGLPAQIVVTAWTWKLTCDAVDLDRIRAFAAERGAAAPGDD